MKKSIFVSLLAIGLCLAWQNVAGTTWNELLDLADSLSKAQNQDSAIVIGKLALEKAVEQFGEADSATALVWHRIGLYNYHKGNYDEAESLTKRALAIREKTLGPEHPEVAKSLVNLAIFYRKQGKYAEGEPLCKRALAIAEKVLGPEHPDVAASLENLAILYSDQGKYAEAELFYKRALAIWEKALGPEHPDVAMSLNNLALLYKQQGKYAEADPLFRRSLAIKEKTLGPDHPRVASSLNNLAILYRRQGMYAAAEPLYKRSLAIREKTLGPDHPYVANSLNLLANLCYDQGKYAEAETLWRQSLAIFEKALGPDHPDIATCLNNLAFLYIKQDKYTEAEPLCKRALAILEKARGPEHPKVAEYLNTLASLYDEQGKYAEAELLHKRALGIAEKGLGPEHPYQANYIEDFSGHHRLTGDGKKALESAGRAFQIRKKNFRDGSTAMSERDALTYSQFMRESANTFLSTYFDFKAGEDFADHSAADVIFSTKGQASEAIFVRAAEMNMLVQLGALADSLRQTRTVLSNLYVSGVGDEGVQSYRDKLDKATRDKEQFESKLARSSASYRNLQDALDISTKKILDVLNVIPGSFKLVEYMKYDYQVPGPDSSIARYLVLVMDNDRVLDIIDLGDASEIDALVDRYRKHMLGVSSAGRMPTVVDQHKYKRIGEELHSRIWQPVEAYAAGVDLVLVAPDGALNMVSFAALMDRDGKYLMEKTPIHYLSSGRDLIRLKDQAETAAGLFALGDPDYGASVVARRPEPAVPADTISEPVYYATRNVRSGCGTLKDITVDPLPGTRKEVKLIASGWSESTDEPAVVCYGSDASEERFKAEAPGRRVIHLATHGYFLEGACQPDIPKRGFGDDVGYVGENPLLLSGLFLAGANLHGEDADSLGAEDGILTAEEVTAMNLDGTELVVLSACETGLGEVKEGEGVYGLRRAFQMAGARTVISALWPVSDKTTADMMSRLYDRKGESLPETIRRIQLKSINELRSQNKADHPFSWAGFIALGDWR